MTSGVGDPCRPSDLHSLAPGQRWSLQIVKGTAAAGTQCGGRLPPPGRSSRELTADLHTVHSLAATWQLPSYKTGHRRRRQQTSNLFLSARPGLSRQMYFGKDTEMKGVGLKRVYSVHYLLIFSPKKPSQHIYLFHNDLFGQFCSYFGCENCHFLKAFFICSFRGAVSALLLVAPPNEQCSPK